MASRPITNAQIWDRVGGLTTSVDGMREDFHRSDDLAREYREKIFDRLQTLDRRTSRLEDDVGEIKPTVTGLSNLRLKAAGAVIVLGIIGAILGGMLSAFVDVIRVTLARVFGSH